METITIRSIGRGTGAPLGDTDPDYVILAFEAETDKGAYEIRFRRAAYNELIGCIKAAKP